MLNQSKMPAADGPNIMDTKPGSEPTKANLPHDFGVDVNNPAERQYASQAALNQDPGRSQTRSNDERGGRRDAGVGVNATNVGAGSGGDLDADVVGLDGRGIAENYPDAAERDADGPDRVRPDAPTSRGSNRLTSFDDVPRGGVVSIDRDTDADHSSRDEGADAIRTTSTDDPFHDAAVGEISRGEAAGPADSSSSSARR